MAQGSQYSFCLLGGKVISSSNSEDSKLYTGVRLALIIGTLSSLALLLPGLVLSALAEVRISQSAVPLAQLIPQITKLQPGAILTLGILALLFTPVIGVILAMVTYLRVKDWLYSGIAMAVLSVILFGLARALL